MSDSPHLLAGSAVLVTGATGFVGGRLARRLAEQEGAVVTGTGRNLDKAAALARAGVQLEAADLRDRAAMGALLEGKDTVFHVAGWLGGARPDPERARAVNADAPEALIRAAAEAGVRRFVHVSTISAYGKVPDGDIDERAPLDLGDTNDEYGRTKAIGEERVLRLGAELGVEAVVLRPGVVYGPGSVIWTATMAKMVQRGSPVMIGRGQGLVPCIFIDDLLDLLVLASVHDAAPGQAFNAAAPHVTWAEFYGHYGRMTGRAPRSVPEPVASALAFLSRFVSTGVPLTPKRLHQVRARTRFRADKAQRLLGWAARTSIDEGMRASEAWLRDTQQLAPHSA